MTHIRLADVVSVRGRFHRSVNLPRDWQRGTDLSDYVLTPSARELAERILGELRAPRGTRSWSVTGPYGSGKSAFGLFLADLLCADYPSHIGARQLTEAAKFPVDPFLPVLVVAERQPLAEVLKASLLAAVQDVSPALSRKIRSSRDLSGEGLAELFASVAQGVGPFGYGGLLLVVDELGKFLEFAAEDPGRADVFLLQQLAEAAERSETPIILITILHSGFADYLRSGDELQRAEWQKVQGRFRDVPFRLPAEQVLALVARAFDTTAPPALAEAWAAEVEAVRTSEAVAQAADRLRLDLLSQCVPLHPIMALLLWPLFRSKVAQNERSLFAFLTSAEPFGLQEFLRTTWTEDDDPPVYRLSDLYDYVTSALGLATFTGSHARKWSLIDYALQRIPTGSEPIYSATVKTIGLLSLYGPAVGLVPSRECLELATGRGLDDVLASLEERCIAIYRKHLGGYGLWEGSDVNLEAAFAEAQDHIGAGDLVARLRRALDLSPVVARAHYIATGTLRYLDADVVAADLDQLESALARSTRADGRLVFAVARSDTAAEAFTALACKATATCSEPLRIVAIPRAVEGLESALRDFECWTWVSRNVAALQGDPVARQEVRARATAARDRFEQLAGPVFGLPGSAFRPDACLWVHAGNLYSISTPLEFQRWVSACCRQTFAKAPHLHNELLNRQELSSAAAAARRNLLERMVEAAGVERLGIEGTPAEASMYESMIRLGGFHRKRHGSFSLGPPTGDWRPAWDAVVRFIGAAARTRRPVTALIDRLSKPPFGIREGPLPILLWSVLLARRDEIAIYEEGVFIPDLRVEVIERLVRRPETFELQSQRLDKHEKAALRALQSVIGDANAPTPNSGHGFLPIVKALILFASRLQPFARKTKRLQPPEAVAVRDRLLAARDPRALLFDELPAAVGVNLESAGGAAELAGHLRECLIALGRVYPHLLDSIEQELRTVFGISGPAVEARRALSMRAGPLSEFAVDQRLRLFVHEAAANRADRDWRESLARVVNDGLPPSHWSDRDATSFQVRLQEIGSEFARLEEMVAEKMRSGASHVLRIGLLDGTHEEHRAVIPMDDILAVETAELAARLREALDASARNGSTRIGLAALAKVAVALLGQSANSEEQHG
jgi:hypothetical protein